MRIATICAAAAAAWLAAAPGAGAATFGFSFVNTLGATAGTVSGTLVLPDGDGTGLAATAVTITSAPAALGYTPPVDVFATFPTIVFNSFDVAGGAITFADFAASAGFEDFSISFTVGAGLSVVGDPDLSNGVLGTIGAQDFVAQQGTAVPLPAGGVRLLTGLAALGLVRRRGA